MIFFFVIILIAGLDRLKETTQFKRWEQNSWIGKIKNDSFREWCESEADKKWRPFGKWTPPQMYDLYHFTKGVIFFLLMAYHTYDMGVWWVLATDALTIWTIQLLFEGDDSK